MTKPATTDPFLEHANEHWTIRRTAFLTREQVARDAMRENVENCATCAEMIAAFDNALMGAFLGGTGPWGGME